MNGSPSNRSLAETTITGADQPPVTHPNRHSKQEVSDSVTPSSVWALANVHLRLLADGPSDSLPDIGLGRRRPVRGCSASLVNTRLNKDTPPGQARGLICEDGAADVTLRVVTNHVDCLDRTGGKGFDLLVVFLQHLFGVIVGDWGRLAAGPRLEVCFSFGKRRPDTLQRCTECSLCEARGRMGSCPLLEVFDIRHFIIPFHSHTYSETIFRGRATHLQIRVTPEYQRLSILLVAMVREVRITVER